MPEDYITISVVKADVGGFVGHTSVHPDVLDTAKERLYIAKEKGVITDSHVLRCGNDVCLLMTHIKGIDNEDIHGLARNVLIACAEVSKELKLYGQGAFSEDIKDMAGVSELEFKERTSEPVLIFMADKANAGAWNLPLYKTFADPFNTSGLVMDASMIEGFSFTVVDALEGKKITLKCPDESYHLLSLIGSISRYMVQSVRKNSDGITTAVASVQKFSGKPGGYAGKGDPVCIVRCQAGMPAVGEVLESFTLPHLVGGWMRGSHVGPLMPVAFYEATPTRFDGPPRVICAGFQISNGRLIGPHDMFDDLAFDSARRRAGRIADYMRGHGPFEPHRLSEQEMHRSAMPKVLDTLKDKFEKI